MIGYTTGATDGSRATCAHGSPYPSTRAIVRRFTTSTNTR
jgi:hypothetical protein